MSRREWFYGEPVRGRGRFPPGFFFSLFIGVEEATTSHGACEGDHGNRWDHFETWEVDTTDVDRDHLRFSVASTVLAGEFRFCVELHHVVGIGPTLILWSTNHDSGVLGSGVGLDGDDRLWEVDGEASFLKGLSSVLGDTDLHSVDLISEVVHLELEVLVGLWHELDEGLDGLNLDDAELHDVDEGVDLRGCGVGRRQVVEFLHLSRDGQLAGLHLHVGVGTNDHLEVNFLTSTDVHVAGSSGSKTVAGDLNGDLFDIGRWIGHRTRGVACQGRTGLHLDLDLAGRTGHGNCGTGNLCGGWNSDHHE